MIKNALYNLSLNLNNPYKKIGLLENFQPVKTLAIHFGFPTIDILQFEKGYFSQKTMRKRSFNNPFSDISTPAPEEEATFTEEVNIFLRANGADWDELILGLPRSQVALKRVSIPAPEKSLIPEILSFEIEKHIPFTPALALYDYKILNESDDKIYSLLVSIVKKDVVSFYLDLLGRLGLVPTIVDISTCAVVNALNFCLNETSVSALRGAYTVIIDKAGSHIEIILLADGEILSSRSLTISEPEGDMPGFMNFLEREVQKTTANYPLSAQGDNPMTLVLSGLEAPEIITGLSDRLPFTVLSLNELSLREKLLPGSLAVTGLALRGMAGNLFTFNLLPKSFKAGKLPTGIITLSLLAAVLLLLPVCALSVYYKNVKKLETVSSLLETAKEQSLTVEKLYQKTDQLKSEARALALLEKKSIKKLNIVKELSQTLPKDVWIHSVTIEKEKLEIVGYADRASPMIKLMEASPLFSDVQFNGRIVKEKRKEKFRLAARLGSVDICC